MTTKSAATSSSTSTTPTSEAQIRANQTNAQKSTGPRTEEGKARAAMNARRHGLTGQFYVMDEADRIAYEAFEYGLLRAMRPVGEYEQQLAISISQDQWRLNRARGIEFNTLGIGHHKHADDIDTDSAEVEVAVTSAKTWLQNDRAIANLALYETRVHRMITKNKKDLDALQATRNAEEAAAREIAELLLARAAAKGEKLETNQRIEINGFVFIACELAGTLTQKQLIEEARFYKSVGWNFSKPCPIKRLNLPLAA